MSDVVIMNPAREELENAMLETLAAVSAVSAAVMLSISYAGNPIIQGQFAPGCPLSCEPLVVEKALSFQGQIGGRDTAFAVLI